MCLGVPGKVLTVEENAQGMAMGTVSFGGINKEVCLAYVPEAKPGDYVIVHVGFAISIVGEEEAAETFEILRQMGELVELGEGALREGPPGLAAAGSPPEPQRASRPEDPAGAAADVPPPSPPLEPGQ